MDDMPRDFGFRYIAWLAWSNAITVLGTLQAIVSLLVMGDKSLFTDNQFHELLFANAVLTIIVAQLKKNNPPGPPPTKAPLPEQEKLP